MAKPKKFEEIAFGPFKATIHLDANSGQFSCAYGEFNFESAVLAEVRSWARERLRVMSNLTWAPILSVSFDNRDTRVNNLENSTSLELYIERFYIAWEGKKWVRTPWVVMPPNHWLCHGPNSSDLRQEDHDMAPEILAQERIARSKVFYAAERCGDVIQFPLIESGGLHPVYHVPYTEERWLTMVGIIEKVRELRERIHAMLSSNEGWNQLAAIAAVKLLPAPPKAKKK